MAHGFKTSLYLALALVLGGGGVCRVFAGMSEPWLRRQGERSRVTIPDADQPAR